MLLPFYMFPKVSARHWNPRAAFSCSISSEENVKVDFHCRSRSWARRTRFNLFTFKRDLLYIACILVYGNARKIYVRTHGKNYTTMVIIFRGTATWTIENQNFPARDENQFIIKSKYKMGSDWWFTETEKVPNSSNEPQEVARDLLTLPQEVHVSSSPTSYRKLRVSMHAHVFNLFTTLSYNSLHCYKRKTVTSSSYVIA